jgi:hypothetical protein
MSLKIFQIRLKFFQINIDNNVTRKDLASPIASTNIRLKIKMLIVLRGQQLAQPKRSAILREEVAKLITKEYQYYIDPNSPC